MKKIFILVAVFATFMFSCSYEEIAEDSNTLKIEQVVAKRMAYYKSKGLTPRIEEVSLEELNEVYRKHGYREVSMDEFKKESALESRSCTWSCDTWVAIGDNNLDAVLNTTDLVNLRSWACEWDEDDCYWSTNINSCTEDCPPNDMYNNAWLTGLDNNTEWNHISSQDSVTNSDTRSMQRRILGIICCN
jgi:hypothetical protein